MWYGVLVSSTAFHFDKRRKAGSALSASSSSTVIYIFSHMLGVMSPRLTYIRYIDSGRSSPLDLIDSIQSPRRFPIPPSTPRGLGLQWAPSSCLKLTHYTKLGG